MRSRAMAASGRESCLLFTCGANSHGQLGIGDNTDQTYPVLLHKPLIKWRQIAGGGAHTLLLDGEGNLYSCGWNKEGQLGQEEEESVLIPRLISNLPKLVKVACGWSHSLAIDVNGRLVSWGSNKYNQLGCVPEPMNRPTVLAGSVFNNEPVIDIGAGLRHSAAINASGCLFTWGDGKKGELGQPDLISTPAVPTQAMSLIGCEGISLGSHFTAVRTVEGLVYCFGDNRHGQCGAPPPPVVGGANKFILPNKVNNLPPISEIHCGWSHCLAITRGEEEKRKVYSWGRGDYGQLGNGCTSDHYEPQEIPVLEGVKQVSCGSEHNLAVNGDGVLMSWGWNEHGSCGNGDTTNRLIPVPVVLPVAAGSIDIISCSAGSSYVTCCND